MITEELLRQVYAEEGNQERTALRLGVGQPHISKLMHRYGIPSAPLKERHKFDPEKVYQDYLLHRSQRKVARIHGINQGTVSNILRDKYKLGRGEEMTNPKELPIADIVARYQSGESCADIAHDLPVHHQRVRQILIQQGIRLRNRIQSAVRGEANWRYTGASSYPGGRGRAASELYTGRRLLRGTIVHHQNEDPFDNSPQNLWIFPNHATHQVYHHRLLRHQRAGQPVDASQIALESGGVPLQRLSGQNESEHAIGLLALFEKEPMR